MNPEQKIGSYLSELSSSAPTPGGGNTAALCGVLASALGIMVCNLTAGRKKYAAVENEILDIKSKIKGYQNIFMELGNADNAAFEKVVESFKLPKESEEDKEKRMHAIEAATFEAAVVPSKVIRTCRETLELYSILIEKGNQNSLSDAGVAISLLNSAAEGALLNVLINYSGLNDRDAAQNMKQEAEENAAEVKKITSEKLEYIKSKLS